MGDFISRIYCSLLRWKIRPLAVSTAALPAAVVMAVVTTSRMATFQFQFMVSWIWRGGVMILLLTLPVNMKNTSLSHRGG